MAKKADENGVTARASDGEPFDSDSEFERRRQLKEAREQAEEDAVKGKRGRPIDEEEPVEAGEEDDGQLFVYEAGRKVSLGTLIPRGTPVEHAVIFGQARRKGVGQLIPFEDDVLLVVRGKVRSVKPTATRNDDESLKSVTVETLIDTKVVVPADSDQAMEMLAGVFAARGMKAA